MKTRLQRRQMNQALDLIIKAIRLLDKAGDESGVEHALMDAEMTLTMELQCEQCESLYCDGCTIEEADCRNDGPGAA